MKFAELKNSLKTNIAPVYSIFGEDLYLINKSIDLIKEAVNASDLDTSRLDETANAKDIITECRTVSFLGGKRLVIVKPFIQDISEYLKKPEPNCVLILVAEAAIKNTESIDCNQMPADILVKLTANQLLKYGFKITQDAASLLCNYCGNLYSRIDGEILKLVNYFEGKDSLGADEINQIVTKSQDYQVYELANAILANGGNPEKAEEILRTLQDQGTEDYAIFGNLVSTFRRIYYSLTCKSPNESVAAVLGCSPYAVNYARRDYKSLTPKIAKLYKTALDLEYKIKSGKVSVNNAIILCLRT